MTLHPKIQVDTAEDIEFLKQKFVRYLNHPHPVIDKLFQIAAPNIQINGISATGNEEALQSGQEYEAMLKEAGELQARVYDKLVKVTQKRKSIPKRLVTERSVPDSFESNIEPLVPVQMEEENMERILSLYSKVCGLSDRFNKTLTRVEKDAQKLDRLLDDLDLSSGREVDMKDAMAK